MDSQSAWRVYKTFGLNRATNYRKHTYIYAEILSQYLDEHVIVRQYREELLIASDWPVSYRVDRFKLVYLRGARDRYRIGRGHDDRVSRIVF